MKVAQDDTARAELLALLRTQSWDTGQVMLSGTARSSAGPMSPGAAGVSVVSMSRMTDEVGKAGTGLVAKLSPRYFAQLRNGFLSTGGGSLYTDALARDDNSLLQWVKWTPRAFLTTVGAPFPWTWRKNGRFDLMRCMAGVESLALLGMLPFAVLGAWRALRSHTLAGVSVVVMFALLTAGLGLVFVNVGTLVRVRLPAEMLLIMLASVGFSKRNDTAP